MQIKLGHYIAVAIIILVTIWIVSGLNIEKTQDDSLADIKDISALTNVQVVKSKASMTSKIIQSTGETQAGRIGKITSQTSGEVIAVLKTNGDFVNKGEIIVKVDPSDLKVQLSSAKALQKQRRLEFEANQSLQKQGLQNKTFLAQSNTAYEQSKTSVFSLELRIKRLNITAPFSGTINNMNLELGSFVSTGMSIADLFDFNPFQVILQISENDIKHIHIDMPIAIQLITGENVNGNVTFINSSANLSTRTFKVEVTIEQNSVQSPKAGITAKVFIPLEKTNAHKLSPALLNLDDNGMLTIFTIDDDNIVVSNQVDIVKSEVDGTWVSGLPHDINLIVVGQGFVEPGDEINPAFRPDSLSNEE
ncbi:MAG: efflux RND transporter periplasmic adaptor subunit [Saccharospirillaceae bacterium]|nr:efflux RND transporter periplasmic adaptor subunit [Pseudomonadales bacterium]NRB77842.1 efflux RND transporter periplasmic adaptor subunit [Saccharospirillaceae bacterium]